MTLELCTTLLGLALAARLTGSLEPDSHERQDRREHIPQVAVTDPLDDSLRGTHREGFYHQARKQPQTTRKHSSYPVRVALATIKDRRTETSDLQQLVIGCGVK